MASMFKLMLLLATSNFHELLLWNSRIESFQPTEYLCHTLGVQNISFWLPNQRLDLRHAVTDQMISQFILNFLKYQLEEFLIFALSTVEDLVYESNLEQLLRRDTLAHD